MFGTLAAFADGQMFMGLFGDDLHVRLPEQERASLLAEGGAVLEPMPGKPMREYVTVPNWRSEPETVQRWSAKALQYALSLPPKKK